MDVEKMLKHYREAGDHYDFKVERGHIQPGKTFSKEAMEELMAQLRLFIGARMMERWESTGEAPTALLVKVDVEAR